MANVLFLDDSDLAGRAMRGILARGRHACFVAPSSAEAWRMLREGVVFDLVIMEMKLPENSGPAFLQRLRDDWFWRVLPVLVYTQDSEMRHVKRALELKVQNYLLKPFDAQAVYGEVAKALQNPWRNLLFEEPKSFCRLVGVTAEQLAQQRREVMVAYSEAAQLFPTWATARQNKEVFARINELADSAEAAGVWAGVDYLRDLQAQALAGNWSVFENSAEVLEFASRLIFCQLNPSYTPDCLCTAAQLEEARETHERERWAHVDLSAGPVLDRAVLEQQIAALGTCPVVDTAAAAFQMMADGKATSLSPVMDLVASDPGLCAQVLVAAGHVKHDEMTAIEDARAAASLLGEMRLHTLAKSLPTALERHLDLPPLNWSGYWMFQAAVGRTAQFICSYLEFDYLKGTAYTAGLIHDVGRLFLLQLHPFGLQAMLLEARKLKVPLSEVEPRFFGGTSRELGAHFAATAGLPPAYADVIRYIEVPDTAPDHHDLVAIVSLARHICLHAHVGNSGESIPTAHISIASTRAWTVLGTRTFPSFDLRKFEVQSHAFCLTLKSELTGQIGDRRPSHAQRAAELV